MTNELSVPATDDWITIPARLQPADEPAPSSTKVRELVLLARGIPCRRSRLNNIHQLQVPAAVFAAACAEIEAFERENHNWPPPPPAEHHYFENTASTLWVLIGLAIFHNISSGQIGPPGWWQLEWTEAGTAEVGKILAGQWWRVITALTLHAGGLHLASNILCGGLFMIRLCHILGAGPAWLLVLLSGAGGNWINALVQPATHRSIGASTAVFGAIGLLAVINMFHYRRSLWKHWPLPAAALALLGLLGTAGENTDLLAHMFGFVCGALLGALACPTHIIQQLQRPLLNTCCAIADIMLLTTAWWCAVYL